MTTTLRPIALGAARAVGLFRLARGAHRSALMVITYHGVVDVDPLLIGRARWLYRNCVTAEQLSAHLLHLKRHYRVLTPAELQGWIERKQSFEGAAVVTFDDGCRSQAAVAGPILEETGVPAVFFLPTGLIDTASQGSPARQWTEEMGAWVLQHEQLVRVEWPRLATMIPGLGPLQDDRIETLLLLLLAALWHQNPVRRAEIMRKVQNKIGGPVDPARFPANRAGVSVLDAMTWDQAARLVSAGSAVGSHTVNHTRLSDLQTAEAETEIAASARVIAKRLGSPCRLFSYPYGGPGDYKPGHRNLLASRGYLAAFTQTPGFNLPETDRFFLKRIDIPGDCDLDRFLYYTSGLRRAGQ